MNTGSVSIKSVTIDLLSAIFSREDTGATSDGIMLVTSTLVDETFTLTLPSSASDADVVALAVFVTTAIEGSSGLTISA